MTKVLFLSRSIPAEDVEQLGKCLKEHRNVSVKLRYPQRSGYGVTFWEILVIYLGTTTEDAITGRALNYLLDVCSQKVKAWYANRVKKGLRRPLSVTLRNATGRVLRALELKPSGEVENVSQRHKGARRVPPPKLEVKKSPEPDTTSAPWKLSKDKETTTIVYCDISNSTLLLSKVAYSRVHEWLKKCRHEWSAIIEMNGGTVFFSHRDNVAGYFRDLADRKDGAERAASSALAISAHTKKLSKHRALKCAKVRVGIATGILSPYQLRPMATINRTSGLAAALSLVSKDDFIAVDQATQKLIASKFVMEECGRKNLLGYKTPVHVWRIQQRSG